MDIHAKLAELNLTLPTIPKAVAMYLPAVRTSNYIIVSGQLCMRNGELIAKGSVPTDVTLEQAQEAAQQCVLNALAAVDQVLEGDWSKFIRIARLGVFVNSDPSFEQQHLVANGGSELLGQVFGEAGRHARAAVGASSLPLGAAVEAELKVEIR